MDNIRVKLLRDEAKLPQRAHITDAGADLFAWNDFTVETFNPNSCILSEAPFKYPCGIAIELPKGYFGLIQAKSSIANKGINTIGNVIDEDYRGEIHVVFANYGCKEFTFKKGQKIAQLIVLPYANVNYSLTDELNFTKRGSHGFGSTGKF